MNEGEGREKSRKEGSKVGEKMEEGMKSGTRGDKWESVKERRKPKKGVERKMGVRKERKKSVNKRSG